MTLSLTEDQLRIGYASTGGRAGLRRLVGRLIWPFLRHQIDFNGIIANDLRNLRSEFDARDEARDPRVDDMLRRLSAFEDQLTEAMRLSNLAYEAAVRHEEPLHRFEEAFEDVNAGLELAFERIELGQRQAFARYHDGASELRRDLIELRQDLVDLQLRVESGIEAETEAITTAHLDAVDELRRAYSGQFDEMRRMVVTRTDGLRAALDDQLQRLVRLDLVISGAARTEVPSAPLPVNNAILECAQEALSGSSAERTQRARHYFEGLAAATLPGPVVDLQCGRGEWLRVLREHGVVSYGLTTAPAAARDLTQEGFDIRDELPLDHLRGLAPASLGAVVAGGLLERLEAEQLVELLELALVKLAPGGILLLEALDPEHSLVAIQRLGVGPGSQRPVPPRLARFVATTVGFADVAIRSDNASAPSQLAPTRDGGPCWADELVDYVNEHLLGPSHYALQGRRP